jgi:hypothetical protein
MSTIKNGAFQDEANKNFFELNPKKTIVLSIILLLFVVDIFGHIFYYFTHHRTFIFNKMAYGEFTPYGLIHHKPNAIIKLPGYPSDLKTDQYGFVGNGYKKEIENDEYLIFIVGGSTVQGTGASSNAATIAACLERILNQRAGANRFRVVNAGVGGFVTYQQLSLIDGEILGKFKPKMILALDGLNDGFYAVSFKEWRPNWQPYVDQLTRDVNRNMEPGFGIMIDLIKRYSSIGALFDKIGKKVFHRDDQAITQKSMPPETRLEAAAQGYLENHLVTRERLHLHGIKYRVFLEPFLAGYLKRKISPEEVKYMQEWGRRYKNPDIFYLGMEKFYALVTQKGENLRFFNDLSKLFMDTPETTYVDHCHFNDTGNLMISEALASRLWHDLIDSQ